MEAFTKCLMTFRQGAPIFYHKVRRNIWNLQCRCQSKQHKETAKGNIIDVRDHLKRTMNAQRSNAICPSQVAMIKDISPTVKQLMLRVDEEFREAANFKAGQWIDMMIPGVDTIGGFSICSSPTALREQGVVELAVKLSDHPPAAWIHSKCQVGSPVKLRVGGTFYLRENDHNVCLIAGGVGVNPLLSIFRHRSDMHAMNTTSKKMSKTVLIYSAKTLDELIFQEEIRKMCHDFPSRCRFHITKEDDLHLLPSQPPTITSDSDIISQESIRDMLQDCPSGSTDSYICGPPNFIEAMEEHLCDLGHAESNIFYEKWW